MPQYKVTKCPAHSWQVGDVIQVYGYEREILTLAIVGETVEITVEGVNEKGEIPAYHKATIKKLIR